MLKSVLCFFISSFCVHAAPAHAAGDYVDYEELTALIAQLEKDKVYEPGELEGIFAQVSRDDRVLPSITKPAESKEWKDYRPLFMTDERISKGVAFWDQYADALTRAEATYGVPAEMIVAIIGVETKYGGNKGRIRVIDSLSTLAFDYPPRAPFFRKELWQFLILAKEQHFDPLDVQGSYAGAMGFPQFMPSSWRNLAVDFDGDGKRDLINDPVDAIGSVANYFKANGWKSGDPVAVRARIISQDYDSAINKDLTVNSTLGEIAKKGLVPRQEGTYLAASPASALRLQGDKGAEFWLAFPNFYVITRYNRSPLYAMAAFQLSQAIKAAHDAEHAPAQQDAPVQPATAPAAG
jgi:membrane-bound lytic murein transglycosylase B